MKIHYTRNNLEKKMELITDKLKLVFDSSNDGNTIRKLFKFVEKNSGIDTILIKKI